MRTQSIRLILSAVLCLAVSGLAFGQARTKAFEIATTIAQNGPIAVRQAKKAIASGAETDLETGMILAIEAYNSTVHTDDRLEGVRAFNERRPPRFQGR